MVVYIHAAQTAIEATGSRGWIPDELSGVGLSGVDIFFVISGVIIAKTTPGLTARQFAWKRFRRIIPLYYVCSIPAALIVVTQGSGWRDLLATVFLWPATDAMTAPLLPVAWTLCFEMLFYAAAALVLVSHRWLYVLLGAFVAAMAIRYAGPVFQFLGNPIILEFLFGVALAHAPMWRIGIAGIPIGAFAILLAGPLGVAPEGDTIEFLRGDDAFQRVLVYGFPAALIVYGTMQVRASESLWTYLGDASYSLYLVHTFPITALLALWNAYPLHPQIVVAAGVTASLLMAWRIHELVERPLLSLLRNPPRLRVHTPQPNP